jgi:hypothetical protein
MENFCDWSVQGVMEHCEHTIAQIKKELAHSERAKPSEFGRLETRLVQLTASALLSKLAREQSK